MNDQATSSSQKHQQLESFENHYSYDATYLHHLLDHSSGGYDAFEAFGAMGNYRKELSAEGFFVSKIATARTEDCGPCTELNQRMAREAGVAEEIIKGALSGKGLPEHLEAIRRFSIAVATNAVEPGQIEQMRERIGAEALAELGLAIASMRVYPCLKRALGDSHSCRLDAEPI